MNFRYDINGLRAIAVIAVVLFHFNISWIPGGFAGVDVFFVISGFLMTSIIFKGLENKDFSLFKFYVARANRIIPALAVLCILLLVFGWFYLTPFDYKTLGKHAAGSVGFVSNIIYWKESGYFDAASHEKWLLHTWSLSVEWQFYIIYPIVLMTLKNFLSLESLKRLIVVGTLLGYFFSVGATMKWADPAYYLLPTRGWEMMLGGVAFLYPWNLPEVKKKIANIIGLMLIFGSYVLVSSEIPWPGHLAFFPVFGTYLIIVANYQSSIITNNFVFQYLGKWSYSIYLWHWPVVVLGYTYALDYWIIIGPLLSLILGLLSFEYIERNNYFLYKRWQEFFKVKPVLLALTVMVPSFIIFDYNGITTESRPISISKEAKMMAAYDGYEMDPTGLFRRCNASLQILATGQPKIDGSCIAKESGGIFLWGDSHMGALSTGLRNHIELNSFSQLTSSGCEPSFILKREGYDRFDVGCDFSNSIALETINQTKPQTVILGMSHNHEKNDWVNTISTLKENGIENIIVIGPFPQWDPSLPSVYTKRHMGEVFIHDKNFRYSLIESNEYMKHISKENEDFIFVDMISNLCKTSNGKLSCRAYVEEELIAFDYGHLSLSGSDFIAKEFVLDYLY
ncbi:acyltransferase family protein [Vibrio penaeicida]|uniref:acyltransferase family protein n=1 Tax=Vibrio penaeicida TaxID=104609 RepID=UPI002736DAB9|nr:acyltransferase family protein [Vibrio penaeicida]MDP2573395.1 acyltransferase family protein [Vibrio penaeicida]